MCLVVSFCQSAGTGARQAHRHRTADAWLKVAHGSRAQQEQPALASRLGTRPGPTDTRRPIRGSASLTAVPFGSKSNIHISTHTACTPLPYHGSRHSQYAWARLERAARSRERNSSPTLWDGDSSHLIWGRFLRSTAHRDNSVHCDRAYAAAWNSRHGSRGLSSGHSH